MAKRLKGFTLIELLIVVAIIAILAAIAIPNFLEAQMRSKVARVKADQRSLATALETYYIDNNSYPAQQSSIGADGYGYNYTLPSNVAGGLKYQPTFRMKSSLTDPLMLLTTPVSYISSIFVDPFSDTKGAAYAYSVSGYGPGWIVWSYGPDVDENAFDPGSDSKTGGDIIVHAAGSAGALTWDFPVVSETFYNAGMQNPTQILIIYATYDPTNGSASNGDVYRFQGTSGGV